MVNSKDIAMDTEEEEEEEEKEEETYFCSREI